MLPEAISKAAQKNALTRAIGGGRLPARVNKKGACPTSADAAMDPR
jgi:hypothetical protein